MVLNTDHGSLASRPSSDLMLLLAKIICCASIDFHYVKYFALKMDINDHDVS